ncbi:MAG: c-type cytochrome [Sulfurimonadaceae bacterium]|nr:c-type cytochrome [Sulfurimonadaceae bacterium]
MKLWLLGAVFVAILLGLTWMMAGGDLGAQDTMGSLALLGAVATAVIAIFVAIKYIRQIQEETASGELAEESWDGIGEYKNELPFGWAIIFLGLNIWAIWYFLIGYPVNSYSQIGEYNEEVAIYNAEFESAHAGMTDADYVEMGQSIFIVQCAPCHGLKADGIDGKAADLNKRISKESVAYMIKQGGNNLKTDFPGGMPGGMLADEAQINAVADYVAGGFKDGHAGAEFYAMGGCNGCHGEKGEGFMGVGPNIAAFDDATVTSVLKDGKKGHIGAMPAFNNLTDIQTKAVSAYVSSLN